MMMMMSIAYFSWEMRRLGIVDSDGERLSYPWASSNRRQRRENGTRYWRCCGMIWSLDVSRMCDRVSSNDGVSFHQCPPSSDECSIFLVPQPPSDLRAGAILSWPPFFFIPENFMRKKSQEEALQWEFYWNNFNFHSRLVNSVTLPIQ